MAQLLSFLPGVHDPRKAAQVPGQGEHRSQLLRNRDEAEGAPAEPLRSSGRTATSGHRSGAWHALLE